MADPIHERCTEHKAKCKSIKDLDKSIGRQWAALGLVVAVVTSLFGISVRINYQAMAKMETAQHEVTSQLSDIRVDVKELQVLIKKNGG